MGRFHSTGRRGAPSKEEDGEAYRALAALLFLYRHVLGLDLPEIEGVVCARRPKRLAVVLTRPEVRAVRGGRAVRSPLDPAPLTPAPSP